MFVIEAGQDGVHTRGMITPYFSHDTHHSGSLHFSSGSRVTLKKKPLANTAACPRHDFSVTKVTLVEITEMKTSVCDVKNSVNGFGTKKAK